MLPMISRLLQLTSGHPWDGGLGVAVLRGQDGLVALVEGLAQRIDALEELRQRQPAAHTVVQALLAVLQPSGLLGPIQRGDSVAGAVADEELLEPHLVEGRALAAERFAAQAARPVRHTPVSGADEAAVQGFLHIRRLGGANTGCWNTAVQGIASSPVTCAASQAAWRRPRALSRAKRSGDGPGGRPIGT